MKNKTAVEWLMETLTEYNYLNKNADHYLEQALEMEKEQIIDAYTHDRALLKITAEQYYNETFSNTSE